MKKYFFTLSLVILLAAGCTNIQPQAQNLIQPTGPATTPLADWKVYSNSKWKFSFSYPGDLILSEHQSGPNVYTADKTMVLDAVHLDTKQQSIALKDGVTSESNQGLSVTACSSGLYDQVGVCAVDGCIKGEHKIGQVQISGDMVDECQGTLYGQFTTLNLRFKNPHDIYYYDISTDNYSPNSPIGQDNINKIISSFKLN